MGIGSIVLEAKNISKSYNEESNNIINILENSSFYINKGETISFIGQSGCGKSTLLQICGLLDNATSGKIFINGQDTSKLNDNQKTNIRKNNIGFIYQMHHLFQELTALENVILPLLIKRENKKIAKQKAVKILSELGLQDRIYHFPSQLSGGERQRVAIARAIITEPDIILADEPTGNLDNENSDKIIDILIKTAKDHNSSLLMVTHNTELAKKTERIITIANHKIVEI